MRKKLFQIIPFQISLMILDISSKICCLKYFYDIVQFTKLNLCAFVLLSNIINELMKFQGLIELHTLH